MFTPTVKTDIVQLFKLTLPILITQICQSGLSLADTILAGQVSALDLSGVAIGAGLWMPTFLLLVGILLSTTPLVGEAVGQQRLDKVPFITQQSLWLALMVGVVGWVVVNQVHYLFTPMGVPANIQPIASRFIAGISLGLPAVCLYTSLRCYTESLAKPIVVTVISFVGLIVNVPLSYLFIHGSSAFVGLAWLNIPAMGGAGCGYASGISLWLNLLMLGGFLAVSKQKAFSETRFYRSFAKPNFSQLKQQLAIGIPIGLSVFFEVSAFSLASLIVSPLGEIAVASHQVAITISSQLFMFPFSVAMALTIMVSNRFGANDYHGLKRIKLIGFGVASTIALISIVLMIIFNRQLPSLFSENADVIAQASMLLWFATVYQLFDAWQVNFAGMLRGIQDTTVPMLITLFCYWGVAIPLGTYLVRFTPMGTKGVWLALVTALGLASLLLGARIWQQQKRLKSIWGIG